MQSSNSFLSKLVLYRYWLYKVSYWALAYNSVIFLLTKILNLTLAATNLPYSSFLLTVSLFYPSILLYSRILYLFFHGVNELFEYYFSSLWIHCHEITKTFLFSKNERYSSSFITDDKTCIISLIHRKKTVKDADKNPNLLLNSHASSCH